MKRARIIKQLKERRNWLWGEGEHTDKYGDASILPVWVAEAARREVEGDLRSLNGSLYIVSDGSQYMADKCDSDELECIEARYDLHDSDNDPKQTRAENLAEFYAYKKDM
jgi:hypothetical protein